MYQSMIETVDKEFKVLSILDKAAAKTPAKTSPMMPIGNSFIIKNGII